MNIHRTRGLGDLIYVDGLHGGHTGKHVLDMFVRRVKKLGEISKITDLADLPEYLSDADPGVVEAAKAKLEELS